MDANGIEAVVPIELSEKELDALRNSANVLKKIIQETAKVKNRLLRNGKCGILLCSSLFPDHHFVPGSADNVRPRSTWHP